VTDSTSTGTQRAPAGKKLVLELLDPMKGEAVQTWQFENRAMITIGRAADNDIALNDLQVSRHHAEIQRLENRWEIISMGRHGTFVGEEIVEKAALNDGATLQFGPTGPKLRFRQERPVSEKETTVMRARPDIGEMLQLDRERVESEAKEITKSPAFRRVQDLADKPRKTGKPSPTDQTKF
jgi:pSer/pThr/pTyr-binding forkhead associated (FHA) protein